MYVHYSCVRMLPKKYENPQTTLQSPSTRDVCDAFTRVPLRKNLFACVVAVRRAVAEVFCRQRWLPPLHQRSYTTSPMCLPQRQCGPATACLICHIVKRRKKKESQWRLLVLCACAINVLQCSSGSQYAWASAHTQTQTHRATHTHLKATV